MGVLDEVYREIILRHYQSPRNFGVLPQATRQAGGMNPSCGDQVEVRVRLEGDTIADIRVPGPGCAISTASASHMTEAVKGKRVEE
ncbi:SUF system NifU family Fe-S cluster assembly protein, partial [Shewanella sp. C31]|nr:SUF system NifU family Fe-S cluster assembly protein [Shewanella electrica]